MNDSIGRDVQTRRVLRGAALVLSVLAMAVGCSPAPSVDFSQSTPETLEIAREISIQEIDDELAGEVGIDAARDLQVTRVYIDELKMAHTRMQQTYRGVPVWGAEAIVHLTTDGKRRAVTSSLQPAIDAELDMSPHVSTEQAVKIAEFGICDDCWTAEPNVDLWVIHHGERDRLAYRVQLARIDGTNQTSMPVVMIDAHTGEELFRYDNLQTATAATLYSGSVTINTLAYNATYYAEDMTRKVGTFTYNHTTSSMYRVADTDNVWAASAATDAHWGAEKVYDYYLSTHNRNGINGSGGPAYITSADGTTGLMSSLVSYSTSYNNVFWDGQKMTYGDGDGTTFGSLVTMDIAGHEMTHGVTQFTANLTYSGESGALNESMSDVFGSMVERYVKGESGDTWKIGEQCYTPANGTGDALRYMNNPHQAANSGFTSDDDPDHYNERYTGTSDNGGVHINSGIGNYAFYLAAKGGTHHLSAIAVTGIGADNAAKIWYRALTTYMTASTNFAGARTATLNAATDLFGANSPQYIAVGTAWAACGIGTVPGDGGGGGGGAGGTGTELLTNGAFEGSVSPWVIAGNAYYVTPGNYPHGGTGYSYEGTVNNGSGTIYQQVAIPTTATGTFTFWLNVTSDETTTTTQYDKLFVEVRNSSGTLLATLATYSNLNKTTAGSYSQKSLSLAAYKGQTVRVQFRGTTDSTLQTTFRIDDASVK